MHGSGWIGKYVDEVLRPCDLLHLLQRLPSTTRVKGVGTSTSGASQLIKVPAAIRAQRENGDWITCAALFCSHELPGDCPALFAFFILANWDANIACQAVYMMVT